MFVSRSAYLTAAVRGGGAGGLRAMLTRRRLCTTSMRCSVASVKMWLDGKEVQSNTSEWIDLTNPVGCSVRLL
ncbi:unnamed protein product, partial [Anisakis simplex]|uniref:Ubiquitin-like domain-containing protein n=1 Tax=Anisakis simplex TaxID=6269 RepID=A0A0M3KK75_ANISI